MRLATDLRQQWMSNLYAEVAKRISRVVRNRAGRDDATQQTMLALWEDPDPPSEFVAYRERAMTIAYNQACTWLRGHFRHREASWEDFNAADALAAPDPLAAYEEEEAEVRAVQAVDAFVAEEPKLADAVEAMKGAARGVSYEETARARGVSPEMLRQRVSRARRVLQPIVLAAMAAAMAVLVTYSVMRKGEEAKNAPDAGAPETPDQESARVARALAVRHCDADQWAACAIDLDDAKRLDPAGESRPEVAAMRAKLEKLTPAPQNAQDAARDEKGKK